MSGYWLPVFTSFVIIFLELGSLKSFGVLFIPMLQSLQCNAAELGAVIGMANSIGFIIAPVTANLARRYSSRVCMMIGGVLLFVGYLVSAFVGNVFQLSITLGITAGVGMGLSYIPQMVVLLEAKSTHPSFMYSVALLGGSFGVMVCPPVVDFLLRAYGWRGTMMITAAAMFNVCAFGALQKPPTRAKLKLKSKSISTERPDVRKESSFSNTVSEVLSIAASWFSLHIFVKEPRVVLHFSVALLQGISSASWMVFLVPHAIARGISPSVAALLSTGGGVGNLVGRISHVLFVDRGIVSAFWMFVLLSLTNAVALSLDYVAGDNYWFLMSLACVNGAVIGVLNILFFLVAKELYDEQYHVDIFVLGSCFYGVGEIVGAFCSGLLHDLTESYNSAFISLAVTNAFTMMFTLTDRLSSGWW